MIATNDSNNFKVVIAGGGVVGLTLANVLQHAGIDYILLEGRPEFAPQLGASIAIFPNGGRILDQLGCYEPLLSTTEPMKCSSFVKPDGSFLIDHDQDISLFESRFGYPLVFQDRQALLKVLYDGIIDKSKCRANSKIARVDHDENGVVVHCEDGSSFQGDIVLGADGIRSKVRKEMWRTANTAQPGLISEKEQKAMTAEYRCLYGIASRVPGIKMASDYHCSLDQHRSMMTIVGRLDRIYFFVFEKLDRVYVDGEIPRFTNEEKEAFVKQNSDLLFRKNLPFRDIYTHHVASDLVCMEEAEYEHWTWGRFAIVGDAIHKTTANQGSGGNQGIESAAVVGNLLKRMINEHGPKPTLEQIETALAEYPKIHQKRTNKIFEGSGKLTRIHALKGTAEKITTYGLLPLAGELLLNKTCATWVNSQLVEFLPVPKRSLKGHMPYNRLGGAGNEESRLLRLLYALPFLGIAYTAAQVAGLITSTITDSQSSEFSAVTHQNASSNPVESSPDLPHGQSLHPFLTALVPLYSILLIEGARRANNLTIASVPTIVAILAQKFTLGAISPLYFFFHYVFSAPIDNFESLDFRLTDLRYTKTAGLAICAFYLLPLAVASGQEHNPLQWMLDFCPILIGVFQFVMARYVLKNTTEHDKVHNPLHDLPVIRWTMYVTSLVPAVSWFRVVSALGVVESLRTMQGQLDYTGAAVFMSALLWLCMMYGDMLKAGMIERQELVTALATGVIATVLVGPGTSVGLGWIWREELLATRKHWGAVTPERLAKNGGSEIMAVKKQQ